MPATPFEIITGCYDVYVAPVGTPFPAPNSTPPSPWTKLGTNGTLDIKEGGVTVAHEQTLVYFRTEGSTGPVKATRTEENLKISLTLVDMKPAQYTYAMAGDTPTSTSAQTGTAGFDTVNLRRGNEVSEFALLVKGDSPMNTTGQSYKAQYEVPRCVQSGNTEIVFAKGEMAGVQYEFSALEDLTAATASQRFGRYKAQDEAAL